MIELSVLARETTVAWQHYGQRAHPDGTPARRASSRSRSSAAREFSKAASRARYSRSAWSAVIISVEFSMAFRAWFMRAKSSSTFAWSVRAWSFHHVSVAFGSTEDALGAADAAGATVLGVTALADVTGGAFGIGDDDFGWTRSSKRGVGGGGFSRSYLASAASRARISATSASTRASESEFGGSGAAVGVGAGADMT